MKILELTLIVIFLAGCASTGGVRVNLPPRGEESSRAAPEGREERAGTAESERAIDYLGLQREIGMDRGIEELGYREKAFDTCRAGYGYSSTRDCRREYFVLIHFQLMCRDTEGTVSTAVTAADIEPLKDRAIAWTLKGEKGMIQTDGSGYGQIRLASRISQKGQRLKLTAGQDFLYLRAGEITRIITPHNWCERN